MSVQSLLNIQSPIWQNKDIGPDSSFVYVNHSYDLAGNLEEFADGLFKVEQDTNCKMSIHGQWIKIKGNSVNSRKNAFILINALTNNSCKEIFLPNVGEAENGINENDSRLSSPSPPPSPLLDADSTLKSTAQIITSTQKSPHNIRKSLTRSSTETQISSMQKSKATSSSPFSSILNPFIPKSNNTVSKSNNKIVEEEEDGLCEQISNTDLNNNNQKEDKKRYSVDFLLLRSDIPSSKKLPSNWKALNEKFPNVCFCGKVLSYFNPYKYHEHWEKTKIQNYELHDSTDSSYYTPNNFGNNMNSTKSYTDDYLNLQTTLKDLNNSKNYPMNKFRHNHEYQTINFHQHPYNYDFNKNVSYNQKQKYHDSFDYGQNHFQHKQFNHQQENQFKRKSKYSFNNHKVFD